MNPNADKSRFKKMLAFPLKWEGGYVNHPADPGGATNFGITQATYDNYLRLHGLPSKSVKYISQEEVHDIYYKFYWLPAKCPRFHDRLALVALDTAINFGVSGWIQFLQEALPAPPIDGIWGRITEAAFQKANQPALALKVIDGRIAYRHLRVRQSPSQQVFLTGWLNRDYDLRKTALTIPD